MEKLNQLLKESFPKAATTFLPLIWGRKIIIKSDLIYPGEPTQLRPGVGKIGVKMKPEYIVIHDTGMTNPEDNALGLSRYIHAQATSPNGRVASWHFSIDDKECYNHIPTDEEAWHAGDGSSSFGSTYYNKGYQKECIGGGNKSGIGIESCINPGNDYPLTVLRLARLTAELLIKYNLGMERIKQHYNFSGKNCPNVIRATTGLWEMFLAAVALEYKLILIDSKAEVEWEISHPHIINRNGTITTPLIDTQVQLNLLVKTKEQIYKYQYSILVLGLSEEKRLAKTYDALISQLIPQVVNKDLDLPLRYEEMNVDISWQSNKDDVVTSQGKYRSPLRPEIVLLTATLSTKNKKIQKMIEVEVG